MRKKAIIRTQLYIPRPDYMEEFQRRVNLAYVDSVANKVKKIEKKYALEIVDGLMKRQEKISTDE